MVIPCIYDDLSYFNSDGIAVMNKNGEECIVNKNNKTIPNVCAFYRDVTALAANLPDYFSEGIGKIYVNKKYGFVDTDGNIIINCQYEEVGEFVEGLAKVKCDGKWGFVDKTGHPITPMKYEEVTSFQSNFAFVNNFHPISKQYSEGMIDRDGNEVIPCEFYQITRLSSSQNYFKVKDFNGNTGIYDSYGTQIIPCIYSQCELINDKYFRAYADNKVGVIDLDGSNILPFIYDQVLDEFNDSFIVKKEDKYGIVDINNELKVQFIYCDAKPFVNGLTMVSTGNGKYFLIDIHNNRKSNDFSLFGIAKFDKYASFRKY